MKHTDIPRTKKEGKHKFLFSGSLLYNRKLTQHCKTTWHPVLPKKKKKRAKQQHEDAME
jgi:hypothetical protein